MGTYSKKNFWFVLVPYPHRQSTKKMMNFANHLQMYVSRTFTKAKKSVMLNFANHLQMYVSRTFTKAKKSVICAEYPTSSKLYLFKWKIYFSQFINKFLKLEEVEYLIHNVKFKMRPALFYVNSLCFPNIF